MSDKEIAFIVGAYPCAPSFHQKDEAMEIEFWRKLSDMPHIRGIEQPCLTDLHPYGDDFLFKHVPQKWEIVVTGVMETMRRRGQNPAFGLASDDEEQRQASLAYYRHVLNKINRTNDRFGTKKVIALELQAAPLAKSTDVVAAAASFQRSLQELLSWDWPCEIIIEHCDAMNGIQPRKGFLPLREEILILTRINAQAKTRAGIAVNWARSAIETQNTATPLEHVQQSRKAGLLKALMFSGTTRNGPYGEWQDLHAPFAPFPHAKAACPASLMTVEAAGELFRQAPLSSLSFAGIKLLEIDPDADVQHRIAIIEDGINALLKSQPDE